MISDKIKSFLQEQGLYDGSDDILYQKVLNELGISLDSNFADFNLHTNAVTFNGRSFEIYNVCWFVLNSDYNSILSFARNKLGIPEEYIPIDGFEAGGGFFYNKLTGSVIEIELGEKLKSFLANNLTPQWGSFNIFLEWYFELS